MPRLRGNPLVAGPDLLRIHVGHSVLVLEMSLWILGGAFVAFFIIRWLVGDPKSLFHKYELVKLNVQLGNVGAVEQRPNNEDVQIAHRIWTELMTRKAAQPIDVGHDVIVEIYNSWYALFGRVRQLISDIPGHMLRKEKSTQELVRIATQTLNNGLRPHLTVTLSPAAQPPVMSDLHQWLDTQLKENKVEPNSGLGKAIKYMLRHWQALTLFLREPGAPLDNNLAERALKKAILHRTNSLFYKTLNGADVGDLYMTLIHTCELNDVNPFDYLTELQRRTEELAASPAEWMPWNYRPTPEQSLSNH
jgi:Transposase IS66 family